MMGLGKLLFKKKTVIHRRHPLPTTIRSTFTKIKMMNFQIYLETLIRRNENVKETYFQHLPLEVVIFLLMSVRSTTNPQSLYGNLKSNKKKNCDESQKKQFQFLLYSRTYHTRM